MEKLYFVLFFCCVAICVGKDESPKSCGFNEVVRCEFPCPPERTCRTRDMEFDCFDVIVPCENKCVCRPGYFRNFLGTCITQEECDKCSGQNEFFACDSACDNECSTLSKQNRTNCPIRNIICNRKCYCDDGYARDGKRNCIPVEQCS